MPQFYQSKCPDPIFRQGRRARAKNLVWGRDYPTLALAILVHTARAKLGLGTRPSFSACEVIWFGDGIIKFWGPQTLTWIPPLVRFTLHQCSTSLVPRPRPALLSFARGDGEPGNEASAARIKDCHSSWGGGIFTNGTNVIAMETLQLLTTEHLLGSSSLKLKINTELWGWWLSGCCKSTLHGC